MPAVHLQQVQQIKTMPLASFYKSCTKTRLHLAKLGAAQSKHIHGGK